MIRISILLFFMLAGFASLAGAVHQDEYKVEFGLLGKNEKGELKIITKTNNIPVTADGRYYRFGAWIEGLAGDEFIVNFKLYKSGSLVESSPQWLINPDNNPNNVAILSPREPSNYSLGDYKMDIYVNNELFRKFVYRLVPESG